MTEAKILHFKLPKIPPVSTGFEGPKGLSITKVPNPAPLSADRMKSTYFNTRAGRLDSPERSISLSSFGPYSEIRSVKPLQTFERPMDGKRGVPTREHARKETTNRRKQESGVLKAGEWKILPSKKMINTEVIDTLREKPIKEAVPKKVEVVEGAKTEQIKNELKQEDTKTTKEQPMKALQEVRTELGKVTGEVTQTAKKTENTLRKQDSTDSLYALGKLLQRAKATEKRLSEKADLKTDKEKRKLLAMLKKQQLKIKRLQKKMAEKLGIKQKDNKGKEEKKRRTFAEDFVMNATRAAFMKHIYERIMVKRGMMGQILLGRHVSGREIAQFISAKAAFLKSKIPELRGKRDGSILGIKSIIKQVRIISSANEAQRLGEYAATYYPAVKKSTYDEGLEGYVRNVVLVDGGQEDSSKVIDKIPVHSYKLQTNNEMTSGN